MNFDNQGRSYPSPSNDESTSRSSLTVLLIEDNPGDALLIEEMLGEMEQRQFDITVCERLSQGLDVTAEQAIDVILLDLSLPDSHGLQTVRRTLDTVSHVPVVVLTGTNDTQLGVSAVAAGAQDYLAKDWVSSVILDRSIMYAIQRKQSEDHRLALAVEQERVRMLANFINDVSHEIRTPLTTIHLNTEGLENFSDLDDRGLRRTQQIKEQTLFINSLVDSMLTLTQLDSVSQLRLSPLNVNHVVQNVSQVCCHRAEEKGLTWLLDLAEDLPPTEADPDRLYTALYNLMNNAIQFTTRDGTVIVKTEVIGTEVGITISDTGIGIEDADLPLIFDRLYRADRARTGRRAGLGLSISQKIVDLHQGRIEVESVPGQGSTFRILLPVAVNSY